jgi:hypothetical protein
MLSIESWKILYFHSFPLNDHDENIARKGRIDFFLEIGLIAVAFE